MKSEGWAGGDEMVHGCELQPLMLITPTKGLVKG